MAWTDSYVAGWRSELDASKQVRPGERSVLLLDSAFLPGIYRRLAAGAVGEYETCYALFDALPGSGDDVRALSPLLVEYSSDNATLGRILAQIDGKPMLTLIQTHETVAELAERLEQWCVIEASDSLFNFRFADTRRLPAIARVLGTKQIAHMLGATGNWQCINRYGKWEKLPLDVKAQPCTNPGKLTDEQFSALVNDSEADEILAVLEADFPDAVRRRLPSWRYDCACQALRSADLDDELDTPTRIGRVAKDLAGESETVAAGEAL